MPHENSNTAPGIVDDLTVELNQWAECYQAFGSAQSVIGGASQRMREATTEAERDSIRYEVLGFLRRLGLYMVSIALPGDSPVDVTETPDPGE